ncbi:putative nuclease HARBI1 [Zeugodacus cucurbitae]|uniref:putative nuclease HARBI1 n=1 Tax=Zeugodacus cucurbitae TaxID=28588 RepID=UPI0023D9402B|nr:putative nuclease HARBI1 [Zeugodacus cucurbitae]XP_054087243.1 putative nuclease HARBI1 [Zeugodacus cucurbitae]XP_054091804.1 putative nuclease HARBI1 [Zeugodacus cucurbitae]
MDVEIGIIYVIMKKRQEEESYTRRRNLAILRNKGDPFQYEEITFRKFFRFPKSLCWDLIQQLKPYDQQQTSIPFELRFISVLYFLSNGSYQHCVGNGYFAVMSQPSVSRSIEKICKLVVERKYNEVRFPNSVEEYNRVKTGFYSKFGIKGVIGAIDCTHIAIIAPALSTTIVPHDYMNRKGYYSINVEAVCDHELIFRHVNAKFPGSCHDSGIWTTSPARIKLIREHSNGAFKWLLGDSGYPLEPWLLTPLTSPETPNEQNFNIKHIRARNAIERAFGVLKSRFRCLSKERALRYNHYKAALFIYTCTIFHNMLQKRGIFIDETEISPERSPPEDVEIRSGEYYSRGRTARQSCINTLNN